MGFLGPEETIIDKLGIEADPRSNFKAEHGHCNVPTGYRQNTKLATWCSKQRTNKGKERLSEEYIGRLEAIGFVWNLR